MVDCDDFLEHAQLIFYKFLQKCNSIFSTFSQIEHNFER